MTEEQLDERCEAYLETRFKARIDFAISQSLVALVDDGIVRRDAQVREKPRGSKVCCGRRLPEAAPVCTGADAVLPKMVHLPCTGLPASLTGVCSPITTELGRPTLRH